jgi:hypothetical protein
MLGECARLLFHRKRTAPTPVSREWKHHRGRVSPGQPTTYLTPLQAVSCFPNSAAVEDTCSQVENISGALKCRGLGTRRDWLWLGDSAYAMLKPVQGDENKDA